MDTPTPFSEAVEGRDELPALVMAAERAVDRAVAAMVRGRANVRALIDKGDYGFATVVDVEIERLLRAQLEQVTPGVPLLGEEEGGAEVARRGDCWLLDPIDGTANYADGSPLCAISLALLRAGRPVIGIIAAPLIGERYLAIEGAGSFCNGARIRVAEEEVGDSLVALSDFAFGSEHKAVNELRFATIEQLASRSMKLRIHGSVALDLAWLAAGRLSATIALSGRPWDVGAGVLLVREAGGDVFDETGAPYRLDSPSTLASVPALRQALLSVVASARDRCER